MPGLSYSKGRNERRRCLDGFTQKEETDEEDAWAAFSRRKKREEKVLGLLHQKAWTTPPKRIERDGGLRLRDFSKEAEASERRTQRLLPSLSGASPKQVTLEKQGAAQDNAARCIGPHRALRRASHRSAFNLFHFSLT